MSQLELVAFSFAPNVSGLRGATTCKIRFWYNRAFLPSEGEPQIQSGTGTAGFYYEYPCTITNGIVTIDENPEFYTTDDAQDTNPQSILLSGALFTDRGALITQGQITIAGKSQFVVPSSLAPATEWWRFSEYNQAVFIANAPASWYTAAEVNLLLAGITAGQVSVTGSPANGDIAKFTSGTTISNQAATGTGDVVRATSPSLVTPALGTPASGALTNCTGLPVDTGVAGLGTNVATFLGTPSSANLRGALTDETGTGAAVFATSPTLVSPALGTPASGALTNCTNLPVATGVSGLGAGVATFLATPSSANLAAAVTGETGSGALVFGISPTLVTPALGVPASGTLTNCSGLPISSGVSGLGSGVASFLTTPSSANLATAITDETGSGLLVFATSPTLTTPNIGAATGTSLATTGLIKSSGTAGIGYATGAGGTVTQLTSKSTGVELNKTTGTITMHNAALNAGVSVAFTLTNSTIAATDVVIVNLKSGNTANSYTVSVDAVVAGSCRISLRNYTGGNLSEAVVLSFAVIKGVAA